MIRRVAGGRDKGAEMIPDHKAHSRRRGLLAWVLLTTVLAASMLATACGGGAPARAPGKPAVRGPNEADVTISGHARVKAIPEGFLGISTEFTTLPLVEQHSVLWERVLGQVEDPVGPLLPLRLGGDSAEHVVGHTENPVQAPPWAFSPSPELVGETAKVISESKLQVIIDINTITSTPDEVGAWMRGLTSSVQLNHGGVLAAFELGNEPDIYSPHAWVGGINIEGNAPRNPSRVEPVNLPDKITATSFAKDFQAYARALSSAAPTVPLIAPALAEATDNLDWIKTLLRYRTKMLRVISAHVYPYSACANPGDPTYPTIQKVLSENATAGMARTVAPAIAVAHQAGLSFRLTEFNSVTCGGLEGVSNTFATALWAPDALFELMHAGVEGANLHARVTSINRPFSFTSKGLETRPLLYGLMLFQRMLGPDARLVPVQLSSPQSLHLKVWATRASVTQLGGTPFIRNPLNVLVINKGGKSALVNLHLPTSRRAFVQRLLAPSASSTSGVTLAGQQLNQQAFWQGNGHPGVSPEPYETPETLSPTGDGSYVLRVRGESAALVTVPVADGTLPAQPSTGPKPLFGYE
jgi:hypothetical protein